MAMPGGGGMVQQGQRINMVAIILLSGRIVVLYCFSLIILPFADRWVCFRRGWVRWALRLGAARGPGCRPTVAR